MNNKVHQNDFFRVKEKHAFHLVDQSPLPFLASLSATFLFLNIVFYLHPIQSQFVHFLDNILFHVAWIFFFIVLFTWFVTVVKESKEGYHTLTVRQGLRYGMLLFIVSEIMFFFAFFWAFFHVSLSPSIAIGSIWPPKSIQALDIWGLPLVNTLLLLSSGVTITLAHRSILQPISYRSFREFNIHLFVTIILGLTFLACQGIEYKYGITFHWKENIYGSTFFATTGFHGLHVTVGTIFLLFCLIRNLPPLWYYFLRVSCQALLTILEFVLTVTAKTPKSHIYTLKILNALRMIRYVLKYLILKEYIPEAWVKYALQKDQHVGFEAAAWYWHFVDVVWIFLFITVYWWGT